MNANDSQAGGGIAALLNSAEFLTAAHELRQLPPDRGREVAFAGRSNAGKSSALNALCRRHGLARTSRTPGRTQQIVLFRLDDERRLADLPGYGYAKVPAALKRHWEQTLDAYLRTRRCLAGVVLIMDARHPLKPFDRQMLAWTQAASLPCHVLVTKSDKLKRGEQAKSLRSVQTALADMPGASAQLFSAVKRTGVEEAREVIDEWLAI